MHETVTWEFSQEARILKQSKTIGNARDSIVITMLFPFLI